MRLLVTGGAGYIGSIVVEKLLGIGHEVTVLDNLQEGNRSAVLTEAKFVKGNFGDKKILKDIFKKYNFEAVLHFAAETTIEFSMTDPNRYFKNNLVNSINLLEVMRESNCKQIIFSSTAATFGEPQYTPIDEKHPQKPINAYGESKLLFEKVLRWYHKAYNFKYIVFRYFNAAGASQKLGEDHKHESHLIPLVLKKAIKVKEETRNHEKGLIEPFVIYGNNYSTKDGTCVRDFIHVLDLADIHIRGLDKFDEISSGMYNLGNGNGFTVLEVMKACERVTGYKIPSIFGERRIGDPAILIASSELANKDLNWKPIYPNIDDIISTAWNWHKSNPQGYTS